MLWTWIWNFWQGRIRIRCTVNVPDVEPTFLTKKICLIKKKLYSPIRLWLHTLQSSLENLKILLMSCRSPIIYNVNLPLFNGPNWNGRIRIKSFRIHNTAFLYFSVQSLHLDLQYLLEGATDSTWTWTNMSWFQKRCSASGNDPACILQG